MPLSGRSTLGDIAVPTLYVYAGADFALGRAAADGTARHVTGTYTYEVIEGASHWLPEESAEVITPMILDHLRSHAIT